MEVIQTTYKGIKYRSRTEARWAAFFDAAAIAVHYEVEGFKLPSGWYLPDFYQPEAQVFFEVKGQEPSDAELALAWELEEATGKKMYFLIGPPSQDPLPVLREGLRMQIGQCRRCPAIWMCARNSWFALEHPQCSGGMCPGKFVDSLSQAITYASQQRFGVHE